MKKSIFTIAILLSIFSVVLNSCDKDNSDDEQDLKVSSLKFTIEGVTTTEVVGEISVCPDGYYTIIGKAPDGSNVAIQIGKILVGETRSICTEEEFENCIENGGIGLTAAALEDVYTSISGSAKRTNTNDIEMSGVARKMSDGTEHTFTLEATASLVSPVNCEQ